MRPSTDVGDLATKVKSAQKFLDKVSHEPTCVYVCLCVCVCVCVCHQVRLSLRQAYGGQGTASAVVSLHGAAGFVLPGFKLQCSWAGQVVLSMYA